MDDLPLCERVVGKILAQRARVLGETPFVNHDGMWHSFAEMDRRADDVAAALAARGIGKGTRVAILMRNRLEYLDLWFGLSRLGALQVPINCEYKATQILNTLRRAPIALVVAEGPLLAELGSAYEGLSIKPPVLVIDSGLSAVPPTLPAADYQSALDDAADSRPPDCSDVSGADAAAVMDTSGTTGPAKGVILSHAQQYILGRNIARDLQLRQDDVYYNFFPLFHNTAQAMITMPALLTGSRLILVDRFSASRFWDDARRHGCTVFYYIGEILRILLGTTPASHPQPSPLQRAWGIGATASDCAEFEKRFGVRLSTGYGSTEANVPCFLPASSGKQGSAGPAIEGFEIRIANEVGEPVKAGMRGEILVRSSEPCALMLGYDADDHATVAAWRDLWFHSGDQGFVDEDGYLFFTGRLKDVIRVRGENVSASEVEVAISALEGVLEIAAIAVPCELGGDDVKVVIVTAPNAALRPDEVVGWARARLPRFAVPRYVEFVARLPKTSTNKVQKHLLRENPLSAATWDARTEAEKCSI